MSLNHLQLPDFIVAEWYKDALLVPPAGSMPLLQPAPQTAPSPSLQQAAPQSAPPPQQAAPPPPPVTLPPTPAPETAPAPPQQAAPKPPPAPVSPSPVLTPAATRAASQTLPNDPPPYKFLGNNRRHITLLVHSPGSGFLPDNQLAFLTKILEACRMTLADIAIVNHASAPVTITALRQQLQPRTVLLFGLDPTAIRLPINFPHFKQLSYDDCTYLSSPALDLLVPDTGDSRLLKSKLWVSLKTLFDV